MQNDTVPDKSGGIIRLLPLFMFLLYAVFWTTYDLTTELWFAMAPSGLVGLALATKALRDHRERQP